jgi:putative ATPase
MQVYVLQPLSVEDMETLLNRALHEDPILKKREIIVEEKTALFRFAGGDARKLLNTIELVVNASDEGQPVRITDQLVTDCLQENPLAYDKNGELHYDIISAFIKSIRGSDPEAAVYWLARLVAGGEDPLFIARRLLVLAAEDIGLANPNALLLANACFDAVHKLGWPESRIVLSETAIYLACSPKSNSAYLAIDEAMQVVDQTGNQPVPLALRNAPTRLMKELDYGKGYQYAHDFKDHFAEMDFLPPSIKGKRIWYPQENPAEERMKDFLEKDGPTGFEF